MARMTIQEFLPRMSNLKNYLYNNRGKIRILPCVVATKAWPVTTSSSTRDPFWIIKLPKYLIAWSWAFSDNSWSNVWLNIFFMHWVAWRDSWWVAAETLGSKSKDNTWLKKVARFPSSQSAFIFRINSTWASATPDLTCLDETFFEINSRFWTHDPVKNDNFKYENNSSRVGVRNFPARVIVGSKHATDKLANTGFQTNTLK